MTLETAPYSLVRKHSRRSVAEVLLRGTPCSRAELARITGLSKQTMSEVMAELEESGLVVASGSIKGATGRSAVSYRIARNAAYSMGVDLGGTKISGALADLAGHVVAELTEPTDMRGGLHIVDQIARLSKELCTRAKVNKKNIRSVVVGSPGVVDPVTGAISLVPNIKDLSSFNVAAALSNKLDTRVTIENDVNLAMLGETWQGCAQGCSNAAFLAIGTGVGLGLICNGKLVRGATGAAGEIAYLPIGSDVASARALDVGSFELEAGSAGILSFYNRLSKNSAGTVREVFDRLAAGDECATQTLDSVAITIARAVVSVAAITDPQLIILGGSIGVRSELADRVRLCLGQIYARPLTLAISTLGSRAGLVGALCLAVNWLHNDLFNVPNLPAEIALTNPQQRKAAE